MSHARFFTWIAFILISSSIRLATAADPFPGNCIRFDSADDSVVVHHDYTLGDFTFEAWIRNMNGPGSDQIAILSTVYEDPEEWSTYGFTFGIGSSTYDDGRLFLSVMDGWSGQSWVHGPSIRGDSTWHHVAVSFDSEARLFVDGVRYTHNAYGYMENDSPRLDIGFCSIEYWYEGYRGEIDELRIWQSNREVQEIREDMHRTLTGNEADLVSYWQFNEAPGSGSILDAAGGFGSNVYGADFQLSPIPVGGGNSFTQTVSGSGNYLFGATGSNLDFSSFAGTDTFVITKLDLAPDPLPGYPEDFDQQYWVYQRYGNGSGAGFLALAPAEALDAVDELNPGNILASRRDATANGTWTAESQAALCSLGDNHAFFGPPERSGQLALARAIQGPQLVSLDPAHGETDVALRPRICVTLDRDMIPGPGEFRVRRISDGSLVGSASAMDLEFSGSTVCWPMSTALEFGYEYYVECDTNALYAAVDSSAWAGIQHSRRWQFQTVTEMITQLNSQLQAISDGSVDWGDYDMDGDLDILLTGSGTRVYRNDEGIFTDIEAGLPYLSGSHALWGDMDRDGDLDVLCSGAGWPGSITSIYRNDGGTFVEAYTNLYGVKSGTIQWFDKDNDGDLDVLLSGQGGEYPSYTYFADTYTNNLDSFNYFSRDYTGIDPLIESFSACGDIDNDGDTDILLDGGISIYFVLRSYTNDFTNAWTVGNDFSGYISGSISLGDYDNDQDLDLIQTGANPSNAHTLLLSNSGGVFNSIGHGLPLLTFSSTQWGDFDGNGELDLLLSGQNGPYGSPRLTRIYLQDAGSFADSGIDLPGLTHSFCRWADMDNDGDLDFILTGNIVSYNGFTAVYRNNSPVANTPPQAPAPLGMSVSGNEYTFNWDAASDEETPSISLSYNIRVRSGDELITTPMALEDGTRLVARRGNTDLNTSWTLRRELDEGFYSWSVQAIDQGFAGSPFCEEQHFVVGNPTLATPMVQIQRQDENNQLSWDPVTHANGYRVEASEDGLGAFVDVTAEGVFGSPTSWTTVVAQGNKRVYRVKALVQ